MDTTTDTITVAEVLAEYDGKRTPAPAVMRAPSSLEQIPITSIRPSMTQIQQLRRSHFDPAKLIELADSIRAQGLLQPILVRPAAPDGVTRYELVCGERRWVAADRAGLAHIDCNVRAMSDEQVLEAQLVENLQREDVHPLEEAEGYRELMELKNYRADELAALIGKSKAYVYARVKLLALCPAARAALDAGEIDASKALVIARFKGDKIQAQALKRLQNSPHYSYKAALETLRSNFMADLTRAPFAREDDTYFIMQKVLSGKRGEEECIALPACTACPNYSRNDLELQASFHQGAGRRQEGEEKMMRATCIGCGPKIPRRKEAPATFRWLTKAEWNRLETELPAHLVPLAQFAVYTGLRQFNVTHLRWEYVDMRRRMVTIPPGEAKAGRVIAIPLSGDAMAVLRGQAGHSDVWVFPYKGKPLAQIKSAWGKACARAGVDCRWHDLRHTWASWAVQRGVPLQVVQELGGWATYAMVLKYAHLSPAHLRKWVNHATKSRHKVGKK